MKKAHYIVFDTETGGFDPTENPIIEIAMIALDGTSLKEIERYETLIKPYDDLIVTKEALKANGLNMSDVHENGLIKTAAYKEITQFIKKLNPKSNKFNKPILVGHNVQFDIDMMEMFFYLNKESNLYDFVNRQTICTMVEAKRMGIEDSLSLSSLCEKLGIVLNNAHKAMPDTLATAEAFRKLTFALRGDFGDVGSSTKKKDKSRFKFQM